MKHSQHCFHMQHPWAVVAVIASLLVPVSWNASILMRWTSKPSCMRFAPPRNERDMAFSLGTQQSQSSSETLSFGTQPDSATRLHGQRQTCKERGEREGSHDACCLQGGTGI